MQSSGLVPERDPSLLFTNAGMVQFKDAFTGVDVPAYTRATSSQRCMRAGGKHNDLDNVGFTPRHHTLFEMLGNFSFADYGKEEAVAWAWEFVVGTMGLPRDRLRVTVLRGDDETADVWRRVAGLPPSRIVECGEEDNFWSMGAGAGPCGPCTEVFWDQGEGYGDGSDDDRWLEIWNVVFMQCQRDEGGGLAELPALSVDTGMGLERMASVLQGVPSNFETDVLAALVEAVRDAVESRTGTRPPYNATKPCASTAAVRVVVDHLRAASWLLAEGVVPSNVGRGYVLRRVMRRAVRYAHKLGIDEPLLGSLVPSYVAACSDARTGAVGERASTVASVMTHEEEIFLDALHRGLALLEGRLARVPTKGTLCAADAFELYDTYGFPLDLTGVVAREAGFDVDVSGAERLMEEQRARSRAAWVGAAAAGRVPDAVKGWHARGISSTFVGYGLTDSGPLANVSVVASEVSPDGTSAWVAIEPCPFYPEGGGQTADTGVLRCEGAVELPVTAAVRPYDGGIALLIDATAGAAHGSEVQVDLSALLSEGAVVGACVDVARRRRIEAHHTGTHVLHAALRRTLGEDTVMQAGSFVGPDYLRFDFTHGAALTPAQLRAIEDAANAVAARGADVSVSVMSIDDAKAAGALAQFDERYGDEVRVVRVGRDESIELCGGCHVHNTSALWPFKIVGETAVAAGVRRIEAVSGTAATEWYVERFSVLERIADALGVPADVDSDTLALKATKLVARNKELRRTVADLTGQLAAVSRSVDAQTTTELPDGRQLPLMVHVIPEAELSGQPAAKTVRERANAVARDEPDALHFVVCGRSLAVAAGNGAAAEAVDASATMRGLAATLGGKGGGTASFAQGQLGNAVDESVLLEAAHGAVLAAATAS